MATRQPPLKIARVKGNTRLTITVGASPNEYILKTTPPGNTGSATWAKNHLIEIHNDTLHRVRLCVKSKDPNSRIAEYFASFIQVNSPSDKEGWVIVQGKGLISSSPRISYLVLSDDAWPKLANQQITLRFGANPETATTCQWDRIPKSRSHEDDIIIP